MRRISVWAAAACAVVSACHSGRAETHLPFGVIQEGPFVAGGQVTIQALDAQLNPSGKSWIVATEDGRGSYSLPTAIDSRYVEVLGSGVYWDASANGLSPSTLGLVALCDLAENDRCDANVLTTAAAPRVRKLVVDGLDFTAARASATTGLLAAFHIPASAALENADDLDVTAAGEANAALLAVSIVVLESAHAQASDADVPSVVAQELASLASDLEADGTLTLGSDGVALRDVSVSLRLALLSTNLQAHYATLSGAVVPPFAEFVDSDGDGEINLVDPPIKPSSTIEGPVGSCFGVDTAVSGSNLAIGDNCVAGSLVGKVSLFDLSGAPLGTLSSDTANTLGFARRIAPGPAVSTLAVSSASGRVEVQTLAGAPVFGVDDALTPAPAIATTGTTLLIGLSREMSGGMSEAGRVDAYGPAGQFRGSLELASPVVGAHLGEEIAAIGSHAFVSVDTDDAQARVIVFDIATGTVLATLLPPSGWSRFGARITAVGARVAVSAQSTTASLDDHGGVALYEADGTLVTTLEDPDDFRNDSFGDGLVACGASLLIGAPGDAVGFWFVYDAASETLVDRIANPRVGVPGFGSRGASSFSNGFAAPATDRVFVFDCP